MGYIRDIATVEGRFGDTRTLFRGGILVFKNIDFVTTPLIENLQTLVFISFSCFILPSLITTHLL